MGAVPSSNWNLYLSGFHNAPYASSTYAAINISSLVQKLEEIGRDQFGSKAQQNSSKSTQPNKQNSAPFNPSSDFSVLKVIESASRGTVTYIAITILSELSFYFNSTIGLGKIALAFTLGVPSSKGSNTYKYAQNLLEKGVFQVCAGMTDYIVGRIYIVAALLSVGNALIPEYTKTAVGKFFVWLGPITTPDSTPLKNEADRDGYSLIQSFADKTQRFIFPDEGASRLEFLFGPSRIANFKNNPEEESPGTSSDPYAGEAFSASPDLATNQ